MEVKISAPGLEGDDAGFQGYAQAGIMMYQSDGFFLRVNQTRDGRQEGAETYFEAVYQVDGVRVLGGRVGLDLPEVNLPTYWLRVVRIGDEVSAAYALDDPAQEGLWIPLTFDWPDQQETSVSFNSVFSYSDAPVYIGPYGGNGSIEVRFEWIRFSPDELVCTEGNG